MLWMSLVSGYQCRSTAWTYVEKPYRAKSHTPQTRTARSTRRLQNFRSEPVKPPPAPHIDNKLKLISASKTFFCAVGAKIVFCVSVENGNLILRFFLTNFKVPLTGQISSQNSPIARTTRTVLQGEERRNYALPPRFSIAPYTRQMRSAAVCR